MKESEREGEGFELVHDSVSCLCCVTSNFSTTEMIFLTPEAQKKTFFKKIKISKFRSSPKSSSRNFPSNGEQTTDTVALQAVL